MSTAAQRVRYMIQAYQGINTDPPVTPPDTFASTFSEPTNGAAISGLVPCSGDASTAGIGTIDHVTISIRDTATDLYWDGTAWVPWGDGSTVRHNATMADPPNTVAQTTWTHDLTGLPDGLIELATRCYRDPTDSSPLDLVTITHTAAPTNGPTFTIQPQSLSRIEPAAASFTAHADPTGGGTVTTQWQQRTGPTGTITNHPATGDTLTIDPTVLADDGRQFRMVATETGGSSPGVTESQWATLSVSTSGACNDTFWAIVGDYGRRPYPSTMPSVSDSGMPTKTPGVNRSTALRSVTTVSDRAGLNAALGDNRTIVLNDGNYGPTHLTLDGYTNLRLVAATEQGAVFDGNFGGEVGIIVINCTDVWIQGLKIHNNALTCLYGGNESNYHGAGSGPVIGLFVEWCYMGNTTQELCSVDSGGSSTPSDGVIIRYCTFRDPNRSGSLFGEALYFGDSTAATYMRNVLVEYNDIQQTSAVYNGGGGAEAVDIKSRTQNITVRYNLVWQWKCTYSGAIVAYIDPNSHDSVGTIDSNIVDETGINIYGNRVGRVISSQGDGEAVGINCGVGSAKIHSNILWDCNTGIWLDDAILGKGNQSIDISHNTIVDMRGAIWGGQTPNVSGSNNAADSNSFPTGTSANVVISAADVIASSLSGLTTFEVGSRGYGSGAFPEASGLLDGTATATASAPVDAAGNTRPGSGQPTDKGALLQC